LDIAGEESISLDPTAARGSLPKDMRCKHCESARLYRHGFTATGVRRYKCRDCGLTFIGADALPRMRIPIVIVGAAVSMFYEGLSLNAIRRQLNRIYEFRPSDSTVYDWALRFTRTSLDVTRDLAPQVGGAWIAHETEMQIGERTVWVWDVFDEETRYLLASKLSTMRCSGDIQRWMNLAIQRAGRTPEQIMADNMARRLDAIEWAGDSHAEHTPDPSFSVAQSTLATESIRQTLTSRKRVMRGMANMAAAELVVGGWQVHYNCLRPHEALDGATPAAAAGATTTFKNWTDIVRRDAEAGPTPI